jgi:hypothetical protein
MLVARRSLWLSKHHQVRAGWVSRRRSWPCTSGSASTASAGRSGLRPVRDDDIRILQLVAVRASLRRDLGDAAVRVPHPHHGSGGLSCAELGDAAPKCPSRAGLPSSCAPIRPALCSSVPNHAASCRLVRLSWSAVCSRHAAVNVRACGPSRPGGGRQSPSSRTDQPAAVGLTDDRLPPHGPPAECATANPRTFVAAWRGLRCSGNLR